MANYYSRRPANTPERTQAEAAAQAIIQQARQLDPPTPADPPLEEPVHRYTRSPFRPAGETYAPFSPASALNGQRELLERLLESSICQNQLLTDLLGAVNAQTAAVLSTQNRLCSSRPAAAEHRSS